MVNVQRHDTWPKGPSGVIGPTGSIGLIGLNGAIDLIGEKLIKSDAPSP
jgi:hypothetical protein